MTNRQSLDLDFPLRRRIDEHAREWRVEVGEMLLTPSSVVSFGMRDEAPVVLKVVRERCDEWSSGEVLAAFDARGVVHVLEYTGGAVLMERLTPATSLASLAIEGHDNEATTQIARVMRAMWRHAEYPASTP